ncbi:zinc ribbon domain-containing protein, partial [Parasutterella excrementihominis]|uniref:zinc ribbon domain-containing protein n=1 Tax=Parasutterella excrementihominis TaxID=487175 RepID=UPI003A955AE2
PRCGFVSAENRKSQATFACIGCGYRSNADEVGAINILRAGRARLACAMSGAVRPLSAGTRRDLLQHEATAAAESLSFMTKRMSSNDYRSDKKKASESWRPCVISSKSFGTDTYAKA